MHRLLLFFLVTICCSLAFSEEGPSLYFENRLVSSDGVEVTTQGPERGKITLKKKDKLNPFIEWEQHLGEVSVGQYRDWTFPLTCVRIEDSGERGTCLYYISISSMPDYSLINDNCSGIIQSYGQTCTTTVRFAPAIGRTSSIIYTISTVGQMSNFRISGSGLAHPNQCTKKAFGSIISVDGRSVSEEIPIVGVNFSLYYASNFDSSYQSVDQEGLPAGVQFNRQGWNPSIYHFYSWSQQRIFKGSGALTNSQSIPTNLISHQVVSADETEVYTFSWAGLHLETRTFLTGALKYQFSHDSMDRLTKITDAYGNETIFNYNSVGDLATVVAPYGQTTTFVTGTNGKFSAITNPQNESYLMSYGPGGLLSTFTKPGGQVTTFTYDSNGKLLKDLGNGGNFWELIESTAGQISKVSQMGRNTGLSITQANGSVERNLT